MTSPVILTESAGHVLYEHGPRLVFVNRGTGWTFWLRFVLGLFTVIVGLNGLGQVGAALLTQQGFLVAGLIMTFVALLFVLGLVALHRWAKIRRARPPTDFAPIVVLDRQSGSLLGADGRPLAPLSAVSFSKVFQFTSSAPGLECRWPGGKAIVHRGGAMGLTGVDGAIDAQRSRGLRAG